MKSTILSCAAFLLLSLGLSAQPQGMGMGQFPQGQFPQGMGQFPERQTESPEVRAKNKADMMLREVGLDEKQYKKVYKLFKRDYQNRENLSSSFGGMSMGGGFPGGGFPGGGMPMGGPGMGGGFPGGGFPGMGPTGGQIDEKYFEKQEKKLQKILTVEQYNKWHAAHPTEMPPMPEGMPPFDFSNFQR